LLHIPRVPPNQPPYAVPPTEFRFPALAALAGRAQLGGDREVALAVYLAARLAHDCSANGLNDASRAERAAAAKTWTATFALPAAVRPAIARLIEATGGDSSSLVADLRAVVASAQGYLDIQSQAELERLAKTMTGNSASSI
jgi:hypothetical protein